MGTALAHDFENSDVFWNRVEKTDGCWLWTAARSGGYGVVWLAGGPKSQAHRIAYEMVHGPIPDGLVIDHLCRNRACVNPDHMEPVTALENGRRGMVGYDNRTECKNGHDITDPANVYTVPSGKRRDCRKCRQDRRDRYNSRM